MIALTIGALIALSIIVGYRWGHKEGTRIAYADARRLILEHPTKALCYIGPRKRVMIQPRKEVI